MIWKFFIISFISNTKLFNNIHYISKNSNINMMNSVIEKDLNNTNNPIINNNDLDSEPIKNIFNIYNIPKHKRGRDERYDYFYSEKMLNQLYYKIRMDNVRMELLNKLENNNKNIQQKLEAIREYNKIYDNKSEFISNIKAGMILADW